MSQPSLAKTLKPEHVVLEGNQALISLWGWVHSTGRLRSKYTSIIFPVLCAGVENSSGKSPVNWSNEAVPSYVTCRVFILQQVYLWWMVANGDSWWFACWSDNLCWRSLVSRVPALYWMEKGLAKRLFPTWDFCGDCGKWLSKAAAASAFAPLSFSRPVYIQETTGRRTDKGMIALFQRKLVEKNVNLNQLLIVL